MPPKLLTRPAHAKPQAKLKLKGKGKAKAVVEAPKTIQDIVLSQQQSFELVKIGVNAAVCAMDPFSFLPLTNTHFSGEPVCL